MWATASGSDLPTHIAHVGLAESADLLVIAPATADSLARLAGGFASDLLAVSALAARCPLLIAPAMDGAMYAHPAVIANVDTLRSRGVTFVEPETGRFASGMVGQGRLPETPTLIGAIRAALGRNGVLAGMNVIVTAGRHARSPRSRPLHHQPIQRQAGVCAGTGSGGCGRKCHADHVGARTDRPLWHKGDSGGISRADA